jgi:hypothetical protein
MERNRTLVAEAAFGDSPLLSDSYILHRGKSSLGQTMIKYKCNKATKYLNYICSIKFETP